MPANQDPAPGPITRWTLSGAGRATARVAWSRIDSSTFAGSRTEMHSRLELRCTSAILDLPPRAASTAAIFNGSMVDGSVGDGSTGGATSGRVAAIALATSVAQAFSNLGRKLVGDRSHDDCTAPSARRNTPCSERLELALADAPRVRDHQP